MITLMNAERFILCFLNVLVVNTYRLECFIFFALIFQRNALLFMNFALMLRKCHFTVIASQLIAWRLGNNFWNAFFAKESRAFYVMQIFKIINKVVKGPHRTK